MYILLLFCLEFESHGLSFGEEIKIKKKVFFEKHVNMGHKPASGFCVLCIGPLLLWTSKFCDEMCHTSGSHTLFTRPTNFFF